MVSERNTRLRYPGGRKSLWGSLAFLVGYLASAAVAATAFGTVVRRTTVPTRDGPTSLAVVGERLLDLPLWLQSGWLYWNAHGVATRVPAGEETEFVFRNLLASAEGPFLVLFAVPPAVLVLAGLAATRDAPTARDLRFDVETGGFRYAVNGALHTYLGQFPLAFLGLLVLPVGALGPDILTGLVLVVFVYPLVFGGVGGLLGRRVARWRHPDAAVERDHPGAGRW